ncbi:transcriptional regulator [Pseudoduganella sp. FT55W]|uniref:Transcriptional regulator n=1 Tax=Duganella rivi TaxID=2666083 RepID=A0A7X4KFI8_9BURK|nr:ogr/Delta-like zinc finger family protein [Duganella rivi]MYM70508.1 transcriptional regulator [Duganella rivi]
MRISIPCPHCDARATARSSRQLSKTLREIYYQCTDVECGHTFVASLEATRTLSPSSKPRTEVRLPLSPAVVHRVMHQLELQGLTPST